MKRRPDRRRRRLRAAVRDMALYLADAILSDPSYTAEQAAQQLAMMRLLARLQGRRPALRIVHPEE